MLKLRRLLSLLLITAVIISSNTMLYAGALTPAQPETLPSSVDLSETPYFPELSGTADHITHQDTIDTTVFSTIHYQFTYMMNRARGVETTFENTFSPLFGNNIMHEKIVKGDYKTNYEQIHTLLKNVGCATNTTIPFRKTYLNSYTDWPEKESMWREATKNRIVDSFDYKLIGGDDTQVTSPDDIDLYELKSAISNGEMPCITIDTGTGYGGHIKAHEAVPANEKYVGQFVKFEQVEHLYESRYHITETYALVGYDDNVWCDINGNDEIDSGEMGILKLAHSNNLGGFIYLAYDFFNKTSSVENFVSQSKYSETRMAPVLALKGIEVEKERSEKEIYVRFTSNLYAPFEIYFTAEGNGEKYEKKFLEGVNYADTTHAYYGPATMIFPLSDLVPGLNNENFHDYTFTMTLKNTGQDSYHHISASTISLVNEYEGTDSYVSTNPLLKASASEVKSITLKNHTLIYYLGYENVTLHYRTANGDFEAVPMVKGEYKNVVGGTSQSEFFHDSYGYKYHYFLEDIEDTEIYFTDDEGHVDDNNGQYYKAKSGNNYFVTEGVKEPLTISEITLTNGTPDIGKYSHFDMEFSGGYAPYTIKCYATNLDTGEEDLYNYPHDEFEPDYKFKKAGNYEISVHIKDFKGDIVSSAIKVKVVDNPFAMTTTADKTECFVAECINFESVTSFENFSLLAENITSSTKYVVRNSENKVMWEETIAADDIDVDGNTSTSRFTYFPRLSGDYTLTITKKDNNNETVENTVKFTVNDRIIGDADGDELVTIMDATMVQRVVAQMSYKGAFHTKRADCDRDSKITIVDATYVQRYVAELNDCKYTGRLIDYTIPRSSISFTNNLGWDEIYCYYECKDKLEKVDWPGVCMITLDSEDYDKDIRYLSIPQSTTRLCFTDGKAETKYIDFDGTDKDYTAIDNGTGSFYEIIEY